MSNINRAIDDVNSERYKSLSLPIESSAEPIQLFDLTVDPLAPPDDPRTIEFDVTFAADDDGAVS